MLHLCYVNLQNFILLTLFSICLSAGAPLAQAPLFMKQNKTDENQHESSKPVPVLSEYKVH